jgi:hypothetical protein
VSYRLPNHAPDASRVVADVSSLVKARQRNASG